MKLCGISSKVYALYYFLSTQFRLKVKKTKSFMLYTIWYWGGEDEHKLSLAAFEGCFQEQLYKQVKKKRKKKKSNNGEEK